CASQSAPLPAPEGVVLTAGEKSEQLKVEWADVAGSRAVGYRLCSGTSTAALNNCVQVDRAAACSAGACSAKVSDRNNTRIFVWVAAIDACNVASAAPAALPSATPIDGELNSGTGWTIDSPCNAQVQYGGGIVSIQQSTNACISAVFAGDDQWQDFTFDFEVRLDDTFAKNHLGGIT